MKMRNKIYSIFSAFAVIFTFVLLPSCVDEDEFYQEEYLAIVPSSFILEEVGDFSFTFSWGNAEGATSYTIQLVDMNKLPTEATTYTTVSDRFYTFQFSESDITSGRSGKVWYARVRANFPMNNYSDWVYLKYEETDDPAILMVGEGIINVVPKLEVLRTTTSTITYEWSFLNADQDITDAYEICLYSNEACEDKDLVVGWTIARNSGLFSPGAGNLTRFTFTGLEPATNYYAKVTNTSLLGVPVPTPVVEGRTADALPAVTATAEGSAKTNDIIVSESFDKLWQGGDIAMFAAGYYTEDRSQNYKASGMDGNNENLAPTRCTQNEFDLFDGSNVTEEYTQGTGLADWAHTGNVTSRASYLKLGAGGANASIWTPELSALPSGLSNVTVSFSAKNYNERLDGSNADQGNVIVRAVAGATISEKRVASGGTVLVESEPIALAEKALLGFETFTVTLSGVTPDSRISIGTSEKRALIDNIVVTYAGAVAMSKLDAPTEVAFDSEAVYSDRLTLKWNAVENAVSYTIEWWATGSEGSPTTITGIDPEATSYTILELTANTQYYARIKACVYNAPEFDSDWSTTVNCSTNDAAAQATPINVTLMAATSSTLTFEWLVDGKDKATSAGYDYNIELFKDENCQNLHVSWPIESANFTYTGSSWSVTEVRFTFAGLDEGTDYYVKVTRTDSPTEPAESTPLKASTTTFDYAVSSNTTAQAGDILVAEDFSGFYLGGDVARKAVAISGETAAQRADYYRDNIVGENPNTYATVVNWTREFNVFNGGNVKPAYTTGTGMADWAQSNDSGVNVSNRSGYVKIGGASQYATIYTPVLSTIPANATATVTVDFDAQIYSEGELKSSTMEVSGWDGLAFANATDETAHKLSGGTQVDVKKVDISDASTEFKHYQVTISGLTATSRIGIGSDRTADKSKARVLVDNIVVKVSEIVVTQQLATPTNVKFDTPATEGELTLNWSAVANAASYEIQYWKTSNSTAVTTETVSGADATSLTLKGLDSETEYGAKVRAIASGYEYKDSEWSAEATATTVAPKSLVLANVTGLSVTDYDFSTVTLGWTAVPDADGYKVSWNGGQVQTVTGGTVTTYTATGFEPGVDVSFSVVAYREESSEYDSPTPATVAQKTAAVTQYAASRTTVTVAWDDIASDRTYTFEIADASSAPTKTTQFTYTFGQKGSYDPPYYYETRFTFNGFLNSETRMYESAENQLKPGTTYYVRVKEGAAASESPWSNYVPVKTLDARVAPTGEIYFEGFDNLIMGGDVINWAVSMGYKTSGDRTNASSIYAIAIACTTPHTTGGNITTFKQDSFKESLAVTPSNAASGDFSIYAGYMKAGNGSNAGGIQLPVMEEKVDANGSDVTLSLKISPWSEYGASKWGLDNNYIQVIVTDGETSRTISSNLSINDHAAGSGFDQDYGGWKDVSIDIPALKQNEIIKLMGVAADENKGRFLFDDISIVKK